MAVTITSLTPYPIECVFTGSTATFTVVATGSGTLTYQWYRDAGIIGGATSSSYTTGVLSVASDNQHTYHVIISDGTPVTSDSIQINVMYDYPTNDGGYGTTKYAAGEYKYGDVQNPLHYNALRKLWPIPELEGVQDDHLHILGEHLDDMFYMIGGVPDTQYGGGLLQEFFSDTAMITLSDWERVYSLQAGTLTDDQRRSQIAAARISKGGLTVAYYTSILVAMGYTAYITEGSAFVFIVSSTSPPATTIPARLFDPSIMWVWTVHYTSIPALDATMQATMIRLKPAWTDVKFVLI